MARTKAAVPYHHGDLREALVRNAAREVARGSGEALTLREVAKSAGVSHAAAYRHFPSKVALLAEVARGGFDRFAGALTTAAGGASLGARITGLGRAYVAFATSEPGTFRLMWSPELKPFTRFPGLAEAADGALAVLLVALDDPTLAVPPREAAMVVWSALHGHALLAMDRQLEGPFGVNDPTTTVDVVAATLSRGLTLVAARAASPRKSHST